MKPVTLWFAVNNRRGLSYNHLSTGHAPLDSEPAPVNAEQAARWKGTLWEPVHAWLTDDRPPVVHVEVER